MMPSVISRPSSITKSRRTPREASSAAIALAPRGARDLLVMAEREIDRPLRAEARLGHRLGGLQHRIEVALVVPGAAAPDEAVGDDAVKGRLLPVLLGARRDRHHVLMRQQRDRLRLRVASPPRCRAGCSRRRPRAWRRHGRPENSSRYAPASRAAPRRPGPDFRNSKWSGSGSLRSAAWPRLRVDRRARHGGDLKLPRAMGDDVERQHAGDDDDRGDREQQDVADDSIAGAWCSPLRHGRASCARLDPWGQRCFAEAMDAGTGRRIGMR